MSIIFYCRTYTAAEALDLLQTLEEEENDDLTIENGAKEIDIAIIPPYEPNGASSDEDSDDEDIPQCNLDSIGRGCLTTECEVFGLTEKSASTSKSSAKFEWKKRAFDSPQYPLPSQNVNVDAEENLSLCSDPIDYFKLFLSDSLIDTIVDESNHYATTKGKVYI